MRLRLLSCLFMMACTRGGFAGGEHIGDSAATVPAGTRISMLKARTVIRQNGTGNVATPTDNRKAGQRNGSAATAPGAVATVTPDSGLSYWWLLVPVAGLVWWQRNRLVHLLH